MNDQGFHEIQLSGKQLVFLFMSAVVLAVVVFLLGVSVGRGVRGSVASASAADVGAPTDTTASAAAPAGTKVTPADLDYREKLQGQSAASSATKPADTPVTTPAAQTDAKATPPAATPEAKTSTPNSTPKAAATKPATPPPAIKPAPAAATTPKSAGSEAGWIVQLNAFSTQGAADSFIKELKAKGYTAYSVNSATLFKVRMGPFADRAEADKMVGRLKKDGYKSLVTR